MKKNNSQTMFLGEYSVRTGKTPQQHKSNIHDKATGEVNPPSKQPSGQRIEANRGEWSGGGWGGGNVCNTLYNCVCDK